MVTEAMREFTKDRYGVDVMRWSAMPCVVEAQKLQGHQSLHQAGAKTCPESFVRCDQAVHLLSAGVSNAEFSETLELCAESG